MGLWGASLDFKLANALAAVPRRVQTLAGIEVDAVARRVDLQIARIELDVLAKSYGLTQATRFINILDAGYADKLEKRVDERALMRGFDVRLQIPIFDFGEVRVRQAEATYMQAVNRLLELAVNARSEARDAYRSYRSAYDIAGHYQREVLPLKRLSVFAHVVARLLRCGTDAAGVTSRADGRPPWRCDVSDIARNDS